MVKKRNKSLLLHFDRILSHDLAWQVIILVGILLLFFFLAFATLSVFSPDWKTYCAENKINEWVFPLYLLIDSNAFTNLYNSPEGGDDSVSRITVLISCIFYVLGAIIFTGMIISVMTNMISRRVENHRNGMIHYLDSGHYVVMGYDDMVPSIIDDIFIRDKKAYVLLITSQDAVKTRERLLKSVISKHIDRIIINYGHRTVTTHYKEIHLEKAQEIFIAGLRSLPAHDATNIECVDSICNYLNGLKKANGELAYKPQKITCVFEDLDTYAAFKTTDIFRRVSDLGIEFVPYNFYAGWARQVFVRQGYKDKDYPDQLIPYPAIYGPGIGPDDTKFVHLVFVGTTNFAVAFAQEAAHVLHFPNFIKNTNYKTRITFIEQNADKEMPLFVTRNRNFFDVQYYLYQDLTAATAINRQVTKIESPLAKANGSFLDVEYEFIKGNVFSTEVQEMLKQWAKDGANQQLSIFLTLVNQRENFIMGMNMPDEVYDLGIPIFIRQDSSDNFVFNLRKADEEEFDYSWIDQNGKVKTERRKGSYANIYPFGMNDLSYCNDPRLIKQAKLINYLYNTADYETRQFLDTSVLNAKRDNDIWTDAERFWQELSVAKKWSNLYCAYSLPCKLASLRRIRGYAPGDTSHDMDDLSPDEIELMAQVEHNRWNVEKLLMGFRKPLPHEDKYSIPDPDNHRADVEKLALNRKLYIHHDIRPFEDLDPIQEIDRQLSSHIPWILKMTND